MRYVGMTQITEEQAELMTTEYQKLNEKTKEIMMEIQKDKVLDAVNQLENKLDDFYLAMNWEKPNPNLAKASQFFGF